MASNLSAQTTLQLTLSGEGADPKKMKDTPVSSATTTPDTGFFTGDDTGAAPFAIGGAICALAVLVIFLLKLRQPKPVRVKAFSGKFGIHDGKNLIRKSGIFFGIFMIAFLATSLIAPNFLSENEGASALEKTNAIEITTSSSTNGGAINASATISSAYSMAVASETVTVRNSTTSGYSIYLSTGSATSNSMNYQGKELNGWITPTPGTLSSKKALGNNEWGFSTTITAQNALQNPAAFAAVPKSGKEVVAKQASGATIANDVTNIVYAMRVNNSIPSGVYSTTIVYTAIANV